MNKELHFETDVDLRISDWGVELAEFSGQPQNETFIGRRYFEVLPRILLDEQDALQLAIGREQSLQFERYRFNCFHSHILADIAIVPLRDTTGKITNVRVVLRPYSRCHVTERLCQSERLIDIGKIASTLAHGVRNPLNAIKGAVVYLREKYSKEKTLEEFTEIMGDEITRLENFISNFLSSSVTAGDTEVMDVNGLLKRIEVLTSLQIYIRQIHSAYELGEVPPIMISAFHLEQAIMNVINNAIEALNNGGRLVVRSLTEKRSDAIFAVIEIADSGPGMYGTQPSGNGKNGKGFGLFITKEIVEHYGGHMEISSDSGVGTTIRLLIPSTTDQGAVL